MDIQLSNGRVVQWIKNDLFHDYTIKLKVDDDHHDNESRCGNPWSQLNGEETALVKSVKPKYTVPFNLTRYMRETMLFTNVDDLKQELQMNCVGADCWGVFTVSADRKHIIKSYYDARNNNNNTTTDLNAKRYALMIDSTPIIKDMDYGHTVVIVFGQRGCMEGYFYKVQDTYVGNIIVGLTTNTPTN